jgi:cytochrome c biogenesis protein CcmG, thiol:disulfide interchange protein DsbE
LTPEASKKFLVFAPLTVFLLMSVFFYFALQMRENRAVDELTSVLVDKPFPDFQLPGLHNDFHTQAELAQGQVTLVNVWGSWCPSCRDEHPYLTQLVEQGVPLVGMNYKDTPEAALDWLDYFGDIYAYHIQDRDGRLGLNLGVYGAPETFIVDKQGIIRYKRVGVVNERVWESEMKQVYLQYGGLINE